MSILSRDPILEVFAQPEKDPITLSDDYRVVNGGGGFQGEGVP